MSCDEEESSCLVLKASWPFYTDTQAVTAPSYCLLLLPERQVGTVERQEINPLLKSSFS